jgi:hypothetical protein
MKELSIEEMSALRGGFLNFNRASVVAAGNTATSLNVAAIVGSANRSGGIGAVEQEAQANAGNQEVSIHQLS